MSISYITQDGDTVDYICFKIYGRTDGTVETVLSANPGLAALGAVLDAGVTIQLPDLADLPQASNDQVGLW